MSGCYLAQLPFRVGDLHSFQPHFKFRRPLQVQQSTQIKRIVKRCALIIQHNVIGARHTHDEIDPGRDKQRQQRVHVVLIGFGVVGVADVAAHRHAHQLAAEMILQPRADDLLSVEQIFRTDEADHGVDQQRFQFLREAHVIVRATEPTLMTKLIERDAAHRASLLVQLGQILGRLSDCQLLSERASQVGGGGRILVRLRQALEYLDVSDCNMEEGSLRVDANVSARLRGESKLGTKTEVKNMNSFSQLERAIDQEVARQTALVQAGGVIESDTMTWDAATGELRVLRRKEQRAEYRYFDEPDLPPLVLSPDLVTRALRDLPERPDER